MLNKFRLTDRVGIVVGMPRSQAVPDPDHEEVPQDTVATHEPSSPTLVLSHYGVATLTTESSATTTPPSLTGIHAHLHLLAVSPRGLVHAKFWPGMDIDFHATLAMSDHRAPPPARDAVWGYGGGDAGPARKRSRATTTLTTIHEQPAHHTVILEELLRTHERHREETVTGVHISQLHRAICLKIDAHAVVQCDAIAHRWAALLPRLRALSCTVFIVVGEACRRYQDAFSTVVQRMVKLEGGGAAASAPTRTTDSLGGVGTGVLSARLHRVRIVGTVEELNQQLVEQFGWYDPPLAHRDEHHTVSTPHNFVRMTGTPLALGAWVISNNAATPSFVTLAPSDAPAIALVQCEAHDVSFRTPPPTWDQTLEYLRAALRCTTADTAAPFLHASHRLSVISLGGPLSGGSSAIEQSLRSLNRLAQHAFRCVSQRFPLQSPTDAEGGRAHTMASVGKYSLVHGGAWPHSATNPLTVPLVGISQSPMPLGRSDATETQ